MPASGARAPFDQFTRELIDICDHLPVPTLIVLDRDANRTQSNPAFRALVGGPDFTHLQMRSRGKPLPLQELPSRVAARTGVELQDIPLEFDQAGTEVTLSSSAWPLRDETGEVRGAIAMYMDVGERTRLARHADAARVELHAAEARYRLIAEAMPQFVWVDAPDGSAVYANQRWLDYIGLTAEQNAGYGWTMTVHPEDAARLDPLRSQTLRTGEDFEGECRYRGRDGKYRWFLFRSIAVREADGTISSWVGTATDIDRQKRAEEQQTFFAIASERLASTLDEATTLQRIAQLCVPALADWCTIDLLDAGSATLRTAVTEHADPARRQRLQQLVGGSHLHADAGFGPPLVARTGKAQIFPLVDAAMMHDAVTDPNVRAILDEAGYSSAIVAPLLSGGDVYGTITLVSADPARLYTDFDLTTAIELARRGAIAIEHSRLFEREHLVATTLQRALLPAELPQTAHVRFDSAYAAAVSGEQVGGDWYDAFELPDGRIAISIGDVAGHGMAAAVTMGTVRQALRTAALERSDPAAVLERASAVLTLERDDTMVTAIFALYDVQTRMLDYAVAGHPRARVVDLHGNVTLLDASGPPLGSLFDRAQMETKRAHIPAGASLVLLTDGLIEYSHDITEGEAHLERVLAARIHAVAANPAQEIISNVLQSEQLDDIAVLVMTTSARPDAIDAVFPALAPSAPAVRALLRAFAGFYALDEDRSFALLCAAGEAVANAIEHPYDAGVGGVFGLRCTCTGGIITLEVRDYGRWRNTVSVDRGRGLTIMRTIARTLDVQQTPNGTTLRLTL